jgi:hypothetical protein
MSKDVKARIRWLLSHEGGRKTLPSGLRYSTIAYFENAADAWSIIADFNEAPDQGTETIATICFLSMEAPTELLSPGNRFDLVEGERVVARGEVIG